MENDANPYRHHHLYEDILAILIGTLTVSLGIAFYAKAALLTSSLAGLALLLQYASGAPFWLIFSLINLPFYIMAVVRMGWIFTIETFIAVTLVSILTPLTNRWLSVTMIEPHYAAIMGGILMGVGLLILFRHRTALGGLNMLAIYLQERFGIRAGYFQLAVDLCILAAALFLLPIYNVVLSTMGAVILNCILAFNHKPGRYTAVSGPSKSEPRTEKPL